jgi:hypothetical protein
MPNWTYAGRRIYVQKISDDVKQILALLQPVAGPTVYQTYGYQTPQYKINALVIGSGDKLFLESLTQSGITFELMSPDGSLGYFYPATLVFDRQRTISQTLTANCYDAVYIVDIELFKYP